MSTRKQPVQGLDVNAAGASLSSSGRQVDHESHCISESNFRVGSISYSWDWGPICTIFSKMGGQLGVDDPRFPTHSSYYKQMKRIHSVLLVENVPEYQSDIPSSELGPSWTTEDEVIDPRNFGVPCARARRYFLAYDTDKVKRRDDVRSGWKLFRK